MSCKSQESFLGALENSINNIEEKTHQRNKNHSKIKNNNHIQNNILDKYILVGNSRNNFQNQMKTTNITKENYSPSKNNNSYFYKMTNLNNHDKQIFPSFPVKTPVKLQSEKRENKNINKKSMVDILTKAKLCKKASSTSDTLYSINNKSVEKSRTIKK